MSKAQRMCVGGTRRLVFEYDCAFQIYSLKSLKALGKRMQRSYLFFDDHWEGRNWRHKHGCSWMMLRV